MLEFLMPMALKALIAPTKRSTSLQITNWYRRVQLLARSLAEHVSRLLQTSSGHWHWMEPSLP